jgi:PEP-CTERM motif
MRMRVGYPAAAVVLALGAFAAPSAQAGYVLTLEEVGSNVVATGSGSIDLSGLNFALSGQHVFPQMSPGLSEIFTGATNLPEVDVYGGTSGPSSFGNGSQTVASSGSGDMVGISEGSTALAVPSGYVSGSPLSDTSTYANRTFAGLGVTPGVYEWTWGAGADQNFTLHIEVGARAVPEPSTWAMMLIGFAGLGYAGCRASRKSVALAA